MIRPNRQEGTAGRRWWWLIALPLCVCLLNASSMHTVRVQNPTAKPAIQSWKSVAFIPVVSSVEVDLTTGEPITGRFRSADERELVLEQDGLLRQVPRAEIRRVILYKGRHAGRGALWRLGIGTGTGDAATGPSYDFGERFLFTLIFVGLGSGIGALLGTLVRERVVIYEVP